MNSGRVLPPTKKAINSLARSYNTLNYQLHLYTLLRDFYPEASLNGQSKYALHKLVNAMLMKHYCGEEIIKYLLAAHFFQKANVVGAYEINVNNSRADFVAINGHSTSFEIKSGLDNLSKLPKQIQDYSRVFDYNCLVTDALHLEKAKELLPDNWGIWLYQSGEHMVERKPKLNTAIDPEAQLQLLSKVELKRTFPNEHGLIPEIIRSQSTDEINTLFKNTLKLRYRERWKFLNTHQRTIFPIDFQFFFNNNIQPKLIYQRS